MSFLPPEAGYEEWRSIARSLLGSGVNPTAATWSHTEQSTLTLGSRSDKYVHTPRVSKRALSLFADASLHASTEKWDLMYRILWRLTHGEEKLLENPLDPDTAGISSLIRQVKRDIHKMHAFVRFKEVDDGRFVAWYRPDHYIVDRAVHFFARRFGSMRWSILTPYRSAHFDDGKLGFSEGVEVVPACEDEVEEMWRAYYGAVFNPARLKVGAMVREMPRRFWSLLPEAESIPELIAEAPTRAARMVADAPRAAQISPYASLDELRNQAASCTACSLCNHATQTVFGVGPANAAIVCIGEQPGDEEDKAGLPFVGPAGEVFSTALQHAGVKRDTLYITNAVKHFKWTQRGKRRLHVRPNGSEIGSCRPWLLAEIGFIKPKILVCLGTSAAHSVLGRSVRIEDVRGAQISGPQGISVLVSYHPSAVLRADQDQKELIFTSIVETLQKANELTSGALPEHTSGKMLRAP